MVIVRRVVHANLTSFLLSRKNIIFSVKCQDFPTFYIGKPENILDILSIRDKL